MKVVLAGCYGTLGVEILRSLVNKGHEVVAVDIFEREINIADKFKFVKADIAKPSQIEGLCDGADAVISVVGLTKTEANYNKTHNEIDYQANLNLLNEAKKAGVDSFLYVSMLKADLAVDVPKLEAKYNFEMELYNSGLNYIIFRPTGYFTDMLEILAPMLEKGVIRLIGNKPVHINPIHPKDLAAFIVNHMDEDENKNVVYNLGGKEMYSYDQIAEMCINESNKKAKIKHVKARAFELFPNVNKKKNPSVYAFVKLAQYVLTEEMVADTVVGDHSFKEYLKKHYEFIKNHLPSN